MDEVHDKGNHFGAGVDFMFEALYKIYDHQTISFDLLTTIDKPQPLD